MRKYITDDIRLIKILDISAEKYIKILSVVGSLVIDFAKTGVKVPIPKEITKYISDNCIKKLRFMMYLPNNKKLRKKEERTFKENQRQKDENDWHVMRSLYLGFQTKSVL